MANERAMEHVVFANAQLAPTVKGVLIQTPIELFEFLKQKLISETLDLIHLTNDEVISGTKSCKQDSKPRRRLLGRSNSIQFKYVASLRGASISPKMTSL